MEKKRTRRRKEDGYSSQNEDLDKPNKQEYIVAKWMKKNLKTKKTKFLNHNVEYFTANRAVDALLKSKFVEGDDALFTTREQIVEYLDIMLEHKFYHRAKKVPVVLDELHAAANAGKKDESELAKEREEKKAKEKKRDKESKNTENDTEKENGNEKSKEKKKRKIRLEMHAEQLFVDSSEAYVWIYDPIPIHYWIYGLILLLGAVGICLFPLWPQTLRKGVYYLSIAAAGFLVFILGLTVLRLIIFTISWVLTAGKLHFWIFPNLTEDVGFFASFWPLYESKYITSEKSSKDKRTKSKAKKSKEKCSDAEDDKPSETESLKSTNFEQDQDLQGTHTTTAQEEDENRSNDKSSQTTSESESEISGKDYEIINRSEVQNVN